MLDQSNPSPPSSPSQPSVSWSTRHRDQRSSSGLQLTRRSPTQERINGILETALERAESNRASSSSPRSPRLQPLLRTESIGQPTPGEESSGDEDGVIIKQPRRPHTLNYQTTAASTVTSTSARARKPVSRNSSRQQVHGQVQSQDRTAGDEEDEKKWWQKALASFRSIELENKGSVARDHLALERTFLAWLRTSLAFASIGIAITQLFRLNTSLSDGQAAHDTLRHLGRPLGTTFLGISIVVLFLGYNRYFQSQKWVIQGKFPASRGTVMFVSLVSFAVIIVALVVVIAVQPSGS